MAIDRQGTGLFTLRILLGVFLLFEGFARIGWVLAISVPAAQLSGWLQAAGPGSMQRWYLEQVALPGVALFARAVPIGEICAGAALVVGIWTPLFAFLAFTIALNLQIASGAILKYSFLTNPTGLPVLGSALALTIGGVRLPWSVR